MEFRNANKEDVPKIMSFVRTIKGEHIFSESKEAIEYYHRPNSGSDFNIRLCISNSNEIIGAQFYEKFEETEKGYRVLINY